MSGGLKLLIPLTGRSLDSPPLSPNLSPAQVPMESPEDLRINIHEQNPDSTFGIVLLYNPRPERAASAHRHFWTMS